MLIRIRQRVLPALALHYSHAMQGLHLTADLFDCACDTRWLTDEQALLSVCRQRIAAVGLRAVAELGHQFPAAEGATGPGGVTATVLLAESHVCIHTWPEQRAITLDVYVCNFSGDHSDKAFTLIDALIAFFSPERVERHALARGKAAQ
jgi:S-adenosylmethionine decarboxylase